MSRPRLSSAERPVRELKVVLLGDTGVGKSSLVLRFVTNNFKPHSESTIGASFMSRTITVDDQRSKIQIWDTAGQEKYHSLAPMYYKGAAAAIVVYDITRPESFNTLMRWVNELQERGPEDMKVCIAGNKRDLEDQRRVDTVEAEAYAREIGAMFVETSAKDDLHVQDMFVDLTRSIPYVSVVPDIRGISLSKPQSDSKRSACC